MERTPSCTCPCAGGVETRRATAATDTYTYDDGNMTCRADLLYSWMVHDHPHIRQLNELLFAWKAKQAAPYSVQYAGGW